jgi:hypothetical protein
MSKCLETSPLGFTECPFCGAKVEIRRSLKTGKAYWTCDGDHDVRACHSQVRLGPRPSRDLIEHRARALAAPKPQRPNSPPKPAASPPQGPALVPARPATAPPTLAPGAPSPPLPAMKTQPTPPAPGPLDVWNNLLGR